VLAVGMGIYSAVVHFTFGFLLLTKGNAGTSPGGLE
jgi:hypothetical protein